jgi:hypothetical protein
MQVIRIHRTLDSDTLPELKPWIGRNVEIVIREEGPTYPVATEKDWEHFFATAGHDLLQPELVDDYRGFDQRHNAGPQL